MACSKKILLVDDEPDILQALTMRLEAAGYEIITANNGYDATDLASKESPDLIICDIGMPEMNGHEVAKKIKGSSATAHIPIIFLTARTELEEMKIAGEEKVDRYITKPVDPQLLLMSIMALLADNTKEERLEL
jgi:two-component system alkaline phosphatase synthesis response regulator PhoP